MIEVRKDFSDAHVLVVDDNDDFAQLVRHFLSPLGVSVEAAASGHEALSKTKDRCFDVIFLDLVMPEVDGLQVAKRLREAGYERPIIAITAQSLTHQQEEAIRAGCDGYYAKPVSLVKLRDVLAHYCGGSRVQLAAAQSVASDVGATTTTGT